MESAQYALYVIHELYLLGVRHFCISPGSRSTPLVLAIETHPDVTSHVFVDEKFWFFALGLAKSTQKPVAVITTSGTAMANVYPAVIEAYQSQVPLIVLVLTGLFICEIVVPIKRLIKFICLENMLFFFADVPPNDGREESISKIRKFALLCHRYNVSISHTSHPS